MRYRDQKIHVQSDRDRSVRQSIGETPASTRSDNEYRASWKAVANVWSLMESNPTRSLSTQVWHKAHVWDPFSSCYILTICRTTPQWHPITKIEWISIWSGGPTERPVCDGKIDWEVGYMSLHAKTYIVPRISLSLRPLTRIYDISEHFPQEANCGDISRCWHLQWPGLGRPWFHHCT